MGKRTNLPKQQIELLAASFLPVIREYYKNEQEKMQHREIVDDKLGIAKPAVDDRSQQEINAAGRTI